jgi:putative Ca2+/H+ antiporter (TMEM165/GDT1 family)
MRIAAAPNKTKALLTGFSDCTLFFRLRPSYWEAVANPDGFMSNFLMVFFSVFAAELGDKTQLATLLFASENKLSPLTVFAASAGALVLSSALAAAAGCLISKYLSGIPLKLIAGIGFVAIGGWTILQALRGG